MTNKPTHDLTLISGEGKAAQFVRIAAVWPTKDGSGFTGEIPNGVTITGRFGLFPRKADTKDDNG
jgi:hypothetical protein